MITVGTLPGFQEFFLQPIIKDRPNISVYLNYESLFNNSEGLLTLKSTKTTTKKHNNNTCFDIIIDWSKTSVVFHQQERVHGTFTKHKYHSVHLFYPYINTGLFFLHSAVRLSLGKMIILREIKKNSTINNTINFIDRNLRWESINRNNSPLSTPYSSLLIHCHTHCIR